MRRLAAAVVVLALALGPEASAAPPLPLTLVADVALPGGATRFDYQWVDAASRRLYVAHLGDSALVAFDLDAQAVLKEIPQLPSVHGVVAAPSLHLVLATATAEKTVALIDDQTFQVKSRVPAGEYPNGLAFDPKTSRVFVSNNTGKGLGVVDAAKAQALPGIELGGGAGNSQYDDDSGHVFVTVHGTPAILEVDPASSSIARRIALRDVATCHGLHVAVKERLAFAACRGAAPALVVVDLGAKKQLASLPLPAGIDVLAFDAGLGRLYAASENGTVAVFDVAGQTVTERGRGFLAANAHSVAVDPKTHRVYFPLENVNGKPVLRVMDPR